MSNDENEVLFVGRFFIGKVPRSSIDKNSRGITTPTIYGDGVKDDTEGFVARYDGRPYEIAASLSAVTINGTTVFRDAKFVVTDTIILENIRMYDCEIRGLFEEHQYADKLYVIDIGRCVNTQLYNVRIIREERWRTITASIDKFLN